MDKRDKDSPEVELIMKYGSPRIEPNEGEKNTKKFAEEYNEMLLRTKD